MHANHAATHLSALASLASTRLSCSLSEALGAMSLSWQSISPETRPRRILRRGRLGALTFLRWTSADLCRAGCNFSAISGADANALRWDRLGYAQLMKTASTAGEKAFVKRTPSVEYWEEHVDTAKLKAMASYLEDVSRTCIKGAHAHLANMLSSLTYSRPRTSPRASGWASRSRPSR